MTEALEPLLAAACRPELPQAATAAKKLVQVFAAVGQQQRNGKGSSGDAKAIKAAALQAFKAAQAKLAEGGLAGAAAQQLVSLTQASLAALEALSPGTAAAPLLPLRYNFVKRLVAARAHEAAWQEAAVLHARLGPNAAVPHPHTADAANVAVGTVLMLLLCCVESPALAGTKLQPSVEAAQALDDWLRLLPEAEAEKHRDALFKYLYKAATQLLERKGWAAVAPVAAAMAGIAACEAHQQRVLQVVLKFAAHMPDSEAAEVAAAAASALLSKHKQLPGSVALDVVGLLCSACQRAAATSTTRSLWEVLLECSRSQDPVMQQAALLLPCLVMQQQGSFPGSWLQHAALATTTAAASATALQQHAAGGGITPDDALRHAHVLVASFQAGNHLRKVLAGQVGAAYEALDGSEGAHAAAAGQLELLARLVGAAHMLLAAGQPISSPLAASLASVAKQGHAAAVGLVTAAKLRATCMPCQGQEPSVVSPDAVAALLGWDFGHYCTSGGPLPGGGLLTEQELSWLVVALYNVGVDLYGDSHFQAAIPPMLAAVSASICCLAEAALQEDEQAVAQRARDVVKRCSALSDTQLRAGDAASAAGTLAHSVAALAQCGLGAPAWQDLLGSLARCRLDALLAEQEREHVASGAPAAPAPKARSARVAKQQPAAAKAKSGTAREIDNRDVGPAALTCSGLLCGRHSKHIAAAVRVAVAEEELKTWAALASSGSSVAGAECERLCHSLLEDAFPAQQCPSEHARVLLAMYQASLAVQQRAGTQLLDSAVVVLEGAEQGDAPDLAGRACGLLSLAAAQQLVEQSTLEQKLQRQQARAVAAASSPNPSCSAVSDSLPHNLNLEAWRPVAARAQRALQHLETALGSTWKPLQLTDWEPVAQLVAELGCMAALQGQGELEVRCRQLCVEVLELLPCSPEGPLVQWAAITPATSWLSFCLFPGLQPAVAEGVPGLKTCLQAWPYSLAALHSSARGNRLDLAAMRRCLHDLAAGPRHNSSGLQRACLHRLIAEQEASDGNMVSALYHATEAHRLVFNASPAMHQQQGASAGAAAAVAAPMGWWQLAAEQLCSMMQLGRLFELSGMAGEAIHALKEGLRMAVSIGSPALAAGFRVQLADIYSKQGSPAVRQALSPVSSLLRGATGVQEAIVDHLRARQLLVEAQISLSLSDYGAAWEHSQAALRLCGSALAASEGSAWPPGHLVAVHAWALLSSALCIAGDGGDTKAAAQLALEAAQMLAGSGESCGSGSSAGLEYRAAALLFLAVQEASPADSAQQGAACLWGLQPSPTEGTSPVTEAQPSSKRAAAAKKPAGRGGTRGKAAAPADEPAAGGAGAAQAGHSSLAVQRLWQAYWLTREVPHFNRLAAARLAEHCGKAGYAHLAALFLHASLGAIMRQQYRLVLHTKLQQCAGKGVTAEVAQHDTLRAALSQLESPLDVQLLCQLAGLEAVATEETPQQQQQQPSRCRRSPAAAEAMLARPQQEALAALDRQAEVALQRWLAVLPEGTVVCSISSQPGATALLPAGRDERIVVSRMGAGRQPVAVQLPAQGAQEAARQHPIKALSLDLEAGVGAGGSSWVHPLAEEMLCLLAESGRSMRDMPTDTREQLCEWWRARLVLDDKLASLLGTVDSTWLSCWRCLLLGAVDGDQEEQSQGADCAVLQLQAHLAKSGRPALTDQQLAGVRVLLASLLQAGSGLGPAEFQNACGQLASWLGLDLPPKEAAAMLGSAASDASSGGVASKPAAQPRSGRQGGRRAAGAAGAGQEHFLAEHVGQPAGKPSSSSSSHSSSVIAAAQPRSRRGRAAKTVTFQVGEEEAPQQQQPRKPAARTLRGSSRATRGGTAAAEAEPGPDSVTDSTEASGCGSPTATDGKGPTEGLCEEFGAMSLQQVADKPRALTTAWAGKHRSRLRMMQASTPGPGAGGSRGLDESISGVKAAATAPRLRGSSAVAKVECAAGAEAAREALEPQRGPVLLVLDGALQVVPWESVPGLRSQRMYRMPSLACAAASAQRSLRDVDLSSTFYSLNPSGDLRSTQTAFQDWFARLQWKGKAGEPPTASEMAEALQSHQLFVYFGHGGGEQYIPLAKLRSLDSCSAALLMGCSSGRLQLGGLYEPTGAVLGYLLAGCPAAVANLWDVTDKDIDRFSQALLNSWLGQGPGSGGNGSSGRVQTPSKVDISSAVAGSRGSCKLPHLIGAAPVCYGLPTSVQ